MSKGVDSILLVDMKVHDKSNCCPYPDPPPSPPGGAPLQGLFRGGPLCGGGTLEGAGEGSRGRLRVVDEAGGGGVDRGSPELSVTICASAVAVVGGREQGNTLVANAAACR